MSQNHKWRISIPLSHNQQQNQDSTSENARLIPQKSINHIDTILGSDTSVLNYDQADTTTSEDECQLEIEGVTNDEELASKKQRRALNFLQGTGKNRRNPQLPSQNVSPYIDVKESIRKQSYTDLSVSSFASYDFREGSPWRLQESHVSEEDGSPQKKAQTQQQQHDTSAPMQSEHNKMHVRRKASSFEKPLIVVFDKKQSKIESVQHLISQGCAANNQWAFDFKFDPSLDHEAQHSNFHQKLATFQKQGLKSLARQLDSLDKAIEVKFNSQEFKSLAKPKSSMPELKIRVKPCEFKKDSLSDIQKIWSKNELPESAQLNYRTSRTQRKLSQDEQDDNSHGFSDVISQLSRKQTLETRPIKISNGSIQGIHQNLRKLTEDLLQSEANSQIGCDSSSISIEKLSPDSSFEKKYRIIFNKTQVGEESLSSQSTNNKRSPPKDSQFARAKFGFKQIDKKYASNDNDQQKHPKQVYNHPSFKIDKPSQSFQQSFLNAYEEKHHPSKFQSAQFQIRPRHTDLVPHMKEAFDATNPYDQLQMKDTGFMSGAFDFETKEQLAHDEIINDQNLKHKANNSKQKNLSAFRKLTLDEPVKESIFTSIQDIQLPQFQYNTRRK